ncbi:MAG: hypothetical protein AAGC60_09845 [Acidobacteriota bacterium]
MKGRVQSGGLAIPVLVAAGVCLILGIASTVSRGLPDPVKHDEHSLLLAADTFAHGRLTTPTPEHWQHFERFHALLEPSYQSKYPTGPSLLLALGQTLGHPIVGVWLGLAALAGATVWMLAGFVDRRWALLGGLLVAVRFGLPNYWLLSYWGGAVAAVGGALVFGALPRMLRPPPEAPESFARRLAAPALFGLGAVLLALSRPLEGLLFLTVCGAVLLVGLGRRPRDERARTAAAWTLGAGAIGLIGIAWLLAHNHAVTGDTLRLPYQEYEAQYAIVPQFLWLDAGEVPAYRHLVHLRYHLGVLARYERLQNPGELAHANVRRLVLSWEFFVGFLLLVPLLAAPWARPGRWLALVAGLCGLYALVLAGYQSFHPHYIAPLTAPLMLVIVAGLERLSRLPLVRRLDASTHARVAWALAGLLLTAVAVERGIVTRDRYLASAARHHAPQAQATLRESLRAQGGRHLVLVHLLPDSSIHDEWIVNGADLGAQAVLWAFDRGPEGNRALLESESGRTAWLLQVGADPRQATLTKVRDAL